MESIYLSDGGTSEENRITLGIHLHARRMLGYVKELQVQQFQM